MAIQSFKKLNWMQTAGDMPGMKGRCGSIVSDR